MDVNSPGENLQASCGWRPPIRGGALRLSVLCAPLRCVALGELQLWGPWT